MSYIETVKTVLETEAQSLIKQGQHLDANALDAICSAILHTKGHLIITGMGKSGHIGNKMAATFASTGTPAFFIHPAEAGHGDLGMITQDDTLLALSYSGESLEILTMMRAAKHLGIGVIALTGNPKSSIATTADYHHTIYITKEACPLGLAPTSSSTATLALGDALAVAMIRAKDFSRDDFARSHPQGRLGRRLTLTNADLMRTGENIPLINPTATIQEALYAITSKGLGMTLIAQDNILEGIFTDGDLRRALSSSSNALNDHVSQHMTINPHYTDEHQLAAEALNLMETYKITTLPVLDHQKYIIGILHIHDLLQAGIA